MMKLTICGYPNKIENKYYKWYLNIICNRLNNKLDNLDRYVECHHILPKSLGGTDEENNLVNLSPKEHFIVHQLLPRFISGQGKYKMIYAASCMFMKTKYMTDRYINSNFYAYIKPHLSKIVSKQFTDLWNDNDYRNKTIQSQKMSWLNGSREYQRTWMKENSPFKNPEIHTKTMKTRELNGTNIWLTNNPMKNKKRALEIASKRSGENHYSRKIRFSYSIDNGNTWVQINVITTLADACKSLGFSYATYMKILANPGFTPARGPMKGMIGKREYSENS